MKRFGRLIGALFLSVIIVLAGCHYEVKDTPRHGPLDAEAVYLIALEHNVVLMTNETNEIFCSGTITKRNGITGVLTAGHCERPDSDVVIVRGQSILAAGVFADVPNAENDLGWIDLILYISTGSPHISSVARISPSDLVVGEQVFGIGCPALNRMEENTFVSGHVAKLKSPGSMLNTGTLLDMQVWFGMSGGAVYNDIGEVVGVISALYRGTSFSIAVSQADIRELLNVKL